MLAASMSSASSSARRAAASARALRPRVGAAVRANVAARCRGFATALRSACAQIPHEHKNSGEDAVFCAAIDGRDVVGVGDGVGGYGSVAGEFSRAILENSLEFLRGGDCTLDNRRQELAGQIAHSCGLPGVSRLAEVEKLPHTRHLQAALVSSFARQTGCAGGTTAVLGMLDRETALFSLLSLGDSRALVIRCEQWSDGSDHGGPFRVNPRTVLSTRAQQYGFNWPYQLGSSALSGRAQYDDQFFKEALWRGKSLAAADMLSLQVRPGDIIVLGSDGLWDNVHDYEVTSVVSRAVVGRITEVRAEARESRSEELMNPDHWGEWVGHADVRDTAQGPDKCDKWVKLIASNLCRLAEAKFRQEAPVDTPWARSIRSAFPDEPPQGGKQDDVSVTVSVVVDASKGPSLSAHNFGRDDSVPLEPAGDEA